MKSITLTAVMAAALLSGCASHMGPQAYQSDPSHSKAWNFAHAAGMTNLKDAKSDSAPQHLKASGSNVGNAIVGGTLGAFSQPLGLSAGVTSGLDAVSALLAPTKQTPGMTNGIVMWFPKSQYPKPDDVYSYSKTTLVPIIESALANWDVPDGYTVDQLKVTETNKWLTWFESSIHGYRCDEPQFQCYVRLMVPGAPNISNALMPDFFGSGPAWKSSILVEIKAVDKSKMREPWYPTFPGLDLLASISQALPSDMFVYASPANTVAFKNDEGQFEFLRMPIVFKGDTAYYFVRPADAADST